MEKLSVTIALAVATIFTAISAKADDFAYMYTRTAEFGTIDLTTGAFSLLGNSTVPLAGMALVNGTLYGGVYGISNGAGNLYTINPANGSLTLVGASGVGYDDFGSTTSGLYAVSVAADLYSVDAATGAATLIGPTGLGLHDSRSLSTNASALYFTVGSNFYTLNTTTGAATLVGNTGGPQMGGILFENGKLFGGQDLPDVRIDTLSLASGLATSGPAVTGTTQQIYALAALPADQAPYAITTLAGFAGAVGSADGTRSAARFNRPFGTAVDSAGNVYVADTDNHTIRKITSGGVVTTLAGSAGNPGSADGTGSAARFSGPYGVAVDNAGNVYVADYFNDTIRKITSGGVVTTLAGLAGVGGSTDGTGSSARFGNPVGVAVDGAGNVYVGDTANHTIRKVSSGGVVTTLAGSAGNPGSADGTGSGARFNQPSGVAVDSAGNVYVADYSNHTIRKITSGGQVTTLAGSPGVAGSADGTGSAAGFWHPGGVAIDSAGNVYVGDSDNNTIRKITSGVVITLAGLAGAPGGSADGTGSAARFYSPVGVAVDSAGKLYIADEANDTIRTGTLPQAPTCTQAPSDLVMWLPGEGNGNDVSNNGNNGTLQNGATFAAGYVGQGFSFSGTSGRVVVPSNPSLDPPSGRITVEAWVYPTTFNGGQGSIVNKRTSANNAGYTLEVTGTGMLSWTVFVDGTPLSVQSNNPLPLNTWTHVAGTSGGTESAIYINGQAAGLTFRGGTVTPTTGDVWIGQHIVNASEWNGLIDEPSIYNRDLAVEEIQGIYNAGRGGKCKPALELIAAVSRKIHGTVGSFDVGLPLPQFAGLYAITTLAGLAGSPGSADGTGTAARFIQPRGAAVDGAGNVYVVDQSNHTIRKISAGGVVTTLAGLAGNPGSADGTVSAARFAFPAGVAVDSASNLYIADTGNQTIRKITSGGVVTTLAGSAGNQGSADGTGANARFNIPSGVAVDSAGNIYVADTLNYTVRKITSSGVVTTLAGSAGNGGSADGTGSAAQFGRIYNVAADSAANIYVADSTNDTIRKITPGGVVTTLAGAAGLAGSVDGNTSDARFNIPNGVAVDGAGNVYVTDQSNATIREITPGGVVRTLAGLARSIGSSDGTGPAARFNGPAGIAVDGAGGIYVVDTYNNNVRAGTQQLPGAMGIECRTGGAGGNHSLAITFSNAVVSGNASVTSGVGSVSGAPTFSGNTMTVNLTGVANAQRVTVNLSNVTDNSAQVLPDTSVTLGFLLGDTNGDRFVNSGDAIQTRNRAGQAISAANFRCDLNVDGSVNSGDAIVVRSRSGTSLP